MKRILALVAVGAMAATLTACSQESTGAANPAAPAGSGGKPTVCLVMKSLANEYFQDMQKGALDHVKERGDLQLTANGTQNETDVDGQIALVDTCITQQVNAIVIAPADSKALIQSVVKATKAGIKVVNIDVKLDDGALSAAGIQVPFVGPDNRAGAKLSGDALAKILGKGAKVVIIEGNPGADNAAQRANGFKDSIKDAGLDLVDSKTAHWETDEANSVFANLLTAHPDITGVFASNDSMALGVLKVIEERSAKVKVASFDNISAIAPFIKNGEVVSTLDQFGSKQAAFGIDYAMKMIAGQTVGAWEKTDVKLITKETLG